MKKAAITVIIAMIAFFVFIPFTAAAEGNDTLTISKSIDSIRYGREVVYTAYVNGETVDGEFMWFVNDVKQEETSNTFTYTHREGEVVIYAKYNNLVSNILTDNVRYTLAELLVYYGLAIIALFAGIPFLILLSRRQHRSPLDTAYADIKRLIAQVCRFEDTLKTYRTVKDIRVIRLSFLINSAAEAALLSHEDTQIALLQIASAKLKEAYNYIHAIKASMPIDIKLEKVELAKNALLEAKESYDTFSKVKPEEAEDIENK